MLKIYARAKLKKNRSECKILRGEIYFRESQKLRKEVNGMISQFKNQKTYFDQAIRNLKQTAGNSSLSINSLAQISNKIFKQELPKALKRNQDKFTALNKWDGETEDYTVRRVQNDASDEDLDLIDPDVINPFILDVHKSNEKVDLMFGGIESITLNSEEDSFEEIDLVAKLDLNLYE